MIRVISATDEKDRVLGAYFQESHDELHSFLIDNGLNESHVNINADNCNITYIGNELPKITEGRPFVFVVYSHGNESSLMCNGHRYVDRTNAQVFSGALVYSTACLAGKELGPVLIEAGCKAFLGFTEPSNAFETEDYKTISQNCDNSGIFQFLSSDDSLRDCYEGMKNYYNTHIDRMDLLLDVVRRAELVANRDALVLLGDGSITRKDFDVHKE